jgi:hypothetical protein
MEEDKNEQVTEIGFYIPKPTDKIIYYKAKEVSCLSDEVIEFYDIEAGMYRVKGVKHLC